MKKLPPVSIVMANWNGGVVYEKCLYSLAKIKYPDWELIVVDNGSTDLTTELSLNPKFKIKNTKLIKNKINLGFAPANNQGYEISRGKYVLLLNNDTLVEPDFLNVLVEKMEKEKDLGVIQPKIRIMDNPAYLDNAGSFLTKIGFLSHWGFMQKDGSEFNKEREVFTTKGACMLIRREVIEKIGLFDDDFMSYFEESDFCWRTWLLGYRVLFYPATFIRHKVGFTIKRLDVSNLNFHYYKNRITSLIKNLEFKNLLYILTAHIVISLGIASVFLVRGRYKNTSMIINACFWNLKNLPKIFKKRRYVQKMRVVKDGEIFAKLVKPVNWSQFFQDFKRVEKDIKDKETSKVISS